MPIERFVEEVEIGSAVVELVDKFDVEEVCKDVVVVELVDDVVDDTVDGVVTGRQLNVKFWLWPVPMFHVAYPTPL